MLSATRAVFFREQGYLMCPRLLDKGLLEEAQRAADQEFARANDPARRLAWDIMEEGDRAVYRLSKMLDRGDVFRSIARHPAAVEAITGLLGPGARLCTNRHNMLIAKAPRVGSAFQWHQDGFSWCHNNVITLMVLLDDATKANGCLWLVPGTHRGYLANIPTGKFQWCMDVEDPAVKDLVAQAFPVEGNAGDAVLFHCLTPHQSAPNTSDRGRRSLSFAYVAARDTWMHHPAKDPIESVPLGQGALGPQ